MVLQGKKSKNFYKALHLYSFRAPYNDSSSELLKLEIHWIKLGLHLEAPKNTSNFAAFV